MDANNLARGYYREKQLLFAAHKNQLVWIPKTYTQHLLGCADNTTKPKFDQMIHYVPFEHVKKITVSYNQSVYEEFFSKTARSGVRFGLSDHWEGKRQANTLLLYHGKIAGYDGVQCQHSYGKEIITYTTTHRRDRQSWQIFTDKLVESKTLDAYFKRLNMTIEYEFFPIDRGLKSLES